MNTVKAGQVADVIGVLAPYDTSGTKRVEQERTWIHHQPDMLEATRGVSNIYVFAEITLDSKSQAAMDSFEAAARKIDDIIECYSMINRGDYLLKIGATDHEQWDKICRDCLFSLPGVKSMRFRFSRLCPNSANDD